MAKVTGREVLVGRAEEGVALVLSGELVSMVDLTVADITKGCFVCSTENRGLFFTTKTTLNLHYSLVFPLWAT